ncbi:MAG: hypothetical protein M3R69_05750 [Acidobacteriota bacterium]|nr:hypothetical protein [Acidobacteriota bacterium]
MPDNSLDERTKKAFDFYADATKQLITLSTAIIAVMITLAKDILKPADGLAKFPLLAALIVYVISICFGLITLLNLTGQLETFNGGDPAQWPRASIYNSEVIKASRWQAILFVVATSLIVISALMFAIKF